MGIITFESPAAHKGVKIPHKYTHHLSSLQKPTKFDLINSCNLAPSTKLNPRDVAEVLCYIFGEYIMVRCLMIATEKLKLKELPVNLQTMVDVLVSMDTYCCVELPLYYYYCFCRCCPPFRVNCLTLEILPLVVWAPYAEGYR